MVDSALWIPKEAATLRGVAGADVRAHLDFHADRFWPMIRELYGVRRGRIVESDAEVLRVVRRWIIFDCLRTVAIAVRFCRRLGRSAFLFLVRRGAAAAWSKVRQGVRQDNWSEGRFGCRWLRFFGRSSVGRREEVPFANQDPRAMPSEGLLDADYVERGG